MFEPLPEEKASQLRARVKALKRVIHSRTIWAIVDPPLKSPEEIAELKESWKAELAEGEKILKRHTVLKRNRTISEKERKKREANDFYDELKASKKQKK